MAIISYFGSVSCAHLISRDSQSFYFFRHLYSVYLRSMSSLFSNTSYIPILPILQASYSDIISSTQGLALKVYTNNYHRKITCVQTFHPISNSASHPWLARSAACTPSLCCLHTQVTCALLSQAQTSRLMIGARRAALWKMCVACFLSYFFCPGFIVGNSSAYSLSLRYLVLRFSRHVC